MHYFKSIYFYILISLLSVKGDRIYADRIEDCPDLLPRSSPPTSAKDVRPDDIKAIGSMGDRYKYMKENIFIHKSCNSYVFLLVYQQVLLHWDLEDMDQLVLTHLLRAVVLLLLAVVILMLLLFPISLKNSVHSQQAELIASILLNFVDWVFALRINVIMIIYSKVCNTQL